MRFGIWPETTDQNWSELKQTAKYNSIYNNHNNLDCLMAFRVARTDAGYNNATKTRPWMATNILALRCEYSVFIQCICRLSLPWNFCGLKPAASAWTSASFSSRRIPILLKTKSVVGRWVQPRPKIQDPRTNRSTTRGIHKNYIQILCWLPRRWRWRWRHDRIDNRQNRQDRQERQLSAVHEIGIEVESFSSTHRVPLKWLCI